MSYTFSLLAACCRPFSSTCSRHDRRGDDRHRHLFTGAPDRCIACRACDARNLFLNGLFGFGRLERSLSRMSRLLTLKPLLMRESAKAQT